MNRDNLSFSCKSILLFFFLLFFLLFFLSKGQLSLWAQNSTYPAYKVPSPLSKEAFQDLLPSGPDLSLRREKETAPEALGELSLQNTGFKRRYLERHWQHLNEEREDIVFLEQAILDQFGRRGFSYELGQHPYHESLNRRFQIVFLLSLPITSLYAYALVNIIKALGKNENSAFPATETAALMGIGFSGWIAYYDRQRSKAYNSSRIEPRKDRGTEFQFWQGKW